MLSTPALGAPPAAQLSQFSLELLREVVALTVSRIEESLAGVPAAAYGVTARTSGARARHAEALRLATALDVARADAN